MKYILVSHQFECIHLFILEGDLLPLALKSLTQAANKMEQ